MEAVDLMYLKFNQIVLDLSNEFKVKNKIRVDENFRIVGILKGFKKVEIMNQFEVKHVLNASQIKNRVLETQN